MNRQTVILNRSKLPSRGTHLAPTNRFDTKDIEVFDDGWGTVAISQPSPRTILIRDRSRSIISWNESPDLGFDRSVNPYRGCEHGCIYCYARPTHCYLGFSAGLDFESKLVFKPDAAALLERALCHKNYVPAPIVLGSNTDPYQPIERQFRLTRALLEVLERFNHPVIIVTKSAGILRDIDLLQRMAERNLACAHISITTLDARLARAMEPRASSPTRRLQAIAGLADAKIPVGVFASPMIPGLNDSELERILQAAASAGASSAASTLLRLPNEVGDLFRDWLSRIVPNRAAKVLGLIRATRNGQLSDSLFGRRFSGSGPYAQLLRSRFRRACRQFALDSAPPDLTTTQFSRPSVYPNEQLDLFL